MILPVRLAKDETLQVLECAEAVHGALGAALEPLFYARALAIQLHACGLDFQRDCWIELRYGDASLGRRRTDFLLDRIAVEVLSVERISNADVLRMRAVIAAAGCPTGLLLNFGGDHLDVRRVDAGPFSG